VSAVDREKTVAVEPMGDDDYRTLATFRQELRRFLKFSDRAAAAVGLTAKQHQALLAIRAADEGAVRVGALAEALLLQSHSATELVDRLEKLGLVERTADREDARRVMVRLTQRGDAQLAALTEAHHAELKRLKPMLNQLIGRL
jgi:DNA-binding MarR family transcriptional regulator